MIGRSRATSLRALLALLGLLLLPGSLPARSIIVERLDAELLVRRDGTLLVTEHIRVAFEGSWNGVLRTLPLEYPGRGGFNYAVFVKVLGATDEEGRPLRLETRRRHGSLEVRIYVPGAADATRTVALRYRVANALRFFDAYDELWWNVGGLEGSDAVQAASARVFLPPTVTGLRAPLVTEGPYGSPEAALADTAGGSYVEARTARPLRMGEGLSVDVAWGPGVVHRPGRLQRAWWFLAGNWALGFPLLALALMLPLWYRRGRDPRLRPIVPRYEPPEGMTPAEAGTLLDNSPDMRDITAMLVALAVAGFIRIEEKEESQLLGLISKREYIFHSLKERAAWSSLSEAERRLLNKLFDDGTARSAELSQLANHFYSALPGIRGAIFDQLVGRGYYARRPDQVMKPYVAGGVLIGVVLAVGGARLAPSLLGQPPLPWVVGGVLTAFVMIVMGRIMPARTARGARALEGVLGFQEFLRRVEGDRLQRVVKTPELFERCLPYAMAFGVESNWARAFEGICREPPSWYSGRTGGPFRAALFTSDLGSMCSRTAGAMSSAPRGSSSGSGFSGGGSFSGGGFGGGSVGGF